MARYSVNNYTVETLLASIKAGRVAIPEMQRPFVWDGSKVRDLRTKKKLAMVHASFFFVPTLSGGYPKQFSSKPFYEHRGQCRRPF